MIFDDIFHALPEVFLLGMICLVVLADVFIPHKRRIVYSLTQLSLMGTAFLVSRSFSLDTFIFFDGHMIVDPLASLLKLFTLLILFVVLLYSRDFMESKGLAKGEYYILTLCATLGMLFMISGNTLLLLYLGLELLSLPLYAMVAFLRNEDTVVEAGMKYFILGAFASGLFLYGASLVFGVSGSIELSQIAASLETGHAGNPLLWVGVVFMLAAFLFKLGGVPFHMWLPDIYAGAPLSVTLLIASAPKIAAFAFMYRILVTSLPSLIGIWWPVLTCVAFLSLLVGNIAAVSQTNIKRLLAYSTIAQVAYVFLGLMTGTLEGFSAAWMYLLTYTLMTTAVFGVLLSLSCDGREITQLDDLKGLSRHRPGMAFLMLIVMLSLAGIPPTVGFFAKFVVLKAMIEVDMTAYAIVAILFSVISAFYYLRIVKVMYFDEPDRVNLPVTQSVAVQWILSLNVLMIFALGIYPTDFIALSYALVVL